MWFVLNTPCSTKRESIETPAYRLHVKSRKIATAKRSLVNIRATKTCPWHRAWLTRKNFPFMLFDHQAKIDYCFSHHKRACRWTQNFFSKTLWPRPLEWVGGSWPLETRPCSRVTTPNLFALCQTIWAFVGFPNVWDPRVYIWFDVGTGFGTG